MENFNRSNFHQNWIFHANIFLSKKFLVSYVASSSMAELQERAASFWISLPASNRMISVFVNRTVYKMRRRKFFEKRLFDRKAKEKGHFHYYYQRNGRKPFFLSWFLLVKQNHFVFFPFLVRDFSNGKCK